MWCCSATAAPSAGPPGGRSSGRTRVARFLLNLAHRVSDATFDMRSVNGESMVVFDLGVDDRIVFGADVRDGRVVTIHAQRNPAKLGHLDAPATLR